LNRISPLLSRRIGWIVFCSNKEKIVMYITAEMGGNGFGNEFLKLAKLLICRKELHLRVVPAYWRSAYRFAVPAGLCFSGRPRRIVRRCTDSFRFETVRFDEAAHKATGITPIEEALPVFIRENGFADRRRTLIEIVEMPGIESIESHGGFLFQHLLSAAQTSATVAKRLEGLDHRKLLVGVHIRRGDFRPAIPMGTDWPQDRWNIQIPPEWYEGVCQKLTDEFSRRIQLIIATDQVDDSIVRLCKRFQAMLLPPAGSRMSPDVMDMLTLASCDALITSASTFSGWAAVLKPKPWLWYTCAHGLPVWGRATGSLYLDEPLLPELFRTQAEAILRDKSQR
jgi:hypothetical protein